MSYPHLVEYIDATSTEAWVRPSGTYTLRTSDDPSAPYVQELFTRGFPGGFNAPAYGDRIGYPLGEQSIFIRTGEFGTYRGTIPTGTALSYTDGTPESVVHGVVTRDFTVTAGSQSGQQTLWAEWDFEIPRVDPGVFIFTQAIQVVPGALVAESPVKAWVRFTDIGTGITDFGVSDTETQIYTAERVRTFVVDSFVSQDWQEGDYVTSQGEHYTIQSRRVLSDRENEFDAVARPRFRAVAPPEEEVA